MADWEISSYGDSIPMEDKWVELDFPLTLNLFIGGRIREWSTSQQKLNSTNEINCLQFQTVGHVCWLFMFMNCQLCTSRIWMEKKYLDSRDYAWQTRSTSLVISRPFVSSCKAHLGTVSPKSFRQIAQNAMQDPKFTINFEILKCAFQLEYIGFTSDATWWRRSRNSPPPPIRDW